MKKAALGLLGAVMLALAVWAGDKILLMLCDHVLSGSIYCPISEEKAKALFLASNITGTQTDASKPAFSKVSGTPAKAISILFIGNSFTYTYDMPGKLIQIASSDANNKIQLEVYSVTRGGAHLAELFQDPEAYNALNSRHWDFVVLQEQSMWTGSQERIGETYSAINQWNWIAKQVGAQPIIYETWPDQAGSPFYTNTGSYFFGQNPEQIQKSMDVQSAALAKALNITMVPVGSYWAYVERQPNAPNLYAMDHHHPSIAGAYLTALVFYRVFTGSSLTSVTYWPPELTQEQAKFLIDIVSK